MSKGPNRILGIVLSAIIIIVAIVAIIASTRTATVFARTTPVGTVQAYLKDVLAGKNAEAAKLFATESACTAADLDRTYIVDMARVNLVSSVIAGDRADVRVVVEFPMNGPFEVSSTQDHAFRLIKSSSSWLLTGIPWPLYDCGALVK